MVREISEWLEKLKLGQYAQTFADNDVDKDLLLELSDEDLVKLGVTSLGHRKRLFKEIAALRAKGPAVNEPPSPHAQDEAERRQITVMFCDLVGSTELSGRLDPEDLREVLRRYQDAVTAAVTRFGGHVGQYLGDGVLVYFGWPHAFEDQAERAVWAALKSIENVKQVAIAGGEYLNARAGIASGPVVIGQFVDYTGQDVQAVTGKTPNLAARLQGMAEPGQVVIDTPTRRLVGTAFTMEDRGRHDLKGFERPVSLWQVTGRGEAESRFEAARSGRLSRLIGRERELALLGKRWNRATKGKGQMVLVSGEAGIGKSRIVQDFCDSLSQTEHFLLNCQCSPLHTNSAFHPIIQFLERMAGFVSDDDEARLEKFEDMLRRAPSETSTDAPLLAALLSLPGKDRFGELDLSAQQIRDRTIDALISRLGDLSRVRPVLFILEDAHWIDPTTQALIGEAMSRMVDAPVMMLITHRPDYAPEWSGKPRPTHIDLHKLSREQGTELVHVAGGDALENKVILQILARADGVPLFIEELTRSLLESEDEQAEIPASLQALLVARLDRLGDAAKVAQLAALLGRSFHYRFIQAVSDLSDTELERALTAMTESELLTQTGTPPRAVYVFRHALIQDAAYETLLKSRRARFHGRTADVLLRDFTNQAEAEPELVARHLSLAGQPDRAVEFWLRAGQRAGERSAHLEAIAHLQRGLRELELLPVSRLRDEHEFAIRLALGASLLTANGWSSPGVEENYHRVHAISRDLGDVNKIFRALRGLCNVFFLKGQITDARRIAEDALAIARDQKDSGLLLDGYRSVGMCSFFEGQFKSAREDVLRANALYDRKLHHEHRFIYGTDPAVVGLSIVAWIHWFLGEFGQSRISTGKALRLAEELNHPFSQAYAQSLAASVCQTGRDARSALQHADRAIAIAEEHGYPYWAAWSTVLRGWSMSELGNPVDGIAVLGTGLEAYENTGAEQTRPYILTLLAEMHGRAGSAGEGLRILEGAIGSGNKTNVRFYEAESHRIRGELLRIAGEDGAQESFERAAALARQQAARALELRAEISAARAADGGRGTSAAARRLAQIYRSFDSDLDDPDLRDARRLLGIDSPED